MRGSSERLIKIMAGDENRFIIPVYQRNYDWKKNQCQQLYDDLVNVVLNNRISHFFGCIVRAQAPGGKPNDYLIIDGQQRLTTVTLLLLAIYKNIENSNIIVKDASLQKKIWYKYIVDEFQPEERKMRLKLVKNDQQSFDALIYKNEDDYILNSNITKNYNYFSERVRNESSISIDKLYDAVTKLEIIDIYLETDKDDPQLIFESLNSTGLDLSEADKIRNYVLMGLDVKKQEKYYEDYWNKIEQNTTYNDVSSFIRDYLTLKTGIISSINKVYFFFKNYVTSNKIAIQDVLTDMLYYSLIYKKIRNAEDRKDNIENVLRRLNQLDTTVMNPYSFALFDYYQKNEIDKNELVDILIFIESFLFRRIICGIPTNALNKIFSSLHKEILKKKKNTNYSYYDVLIYSLENRRGSNIFPNDEEFKNNLINKNIYKMRSKNTHYLFDRLENGNSKEFHDILNEMNEGNLTIEHIMPQHLTLIWKKDLGDDYNRIYNEKLDTISNLTLTAYNSEYSNSPFIKKRDMQNGFKDSRLWLNKYVSSCNKWTEKEMINRQKIIVKRALPLWSYPTTSYIPTEKDSNTIGLDEEFDYTFQDIESFKLMGTIRKVSNWTECICEITKELYSLDMEPILNEIQSNKKSYLSSDKLAKKYQKIDQGLFLNTKTSTNTKIYIIRHLFDIYNLDQSELEFNLKNNELTQ